MNYYSESSKKRLSQCHVELQLICRDLLQSFDHSVLCGHRDEEEQDKVFDAGLSHVKYPDSKHNGYPSMAVDIAPYPRGNNNANDHILHHMMTGEVFRIAYVLCKEGLLSHDIRWGGNWDGDRQFDDQKLIDLQHIELIAPI